MSSVAVLVAALVLLALLVIQTHRAERPQGLSPPPGFTVQALNLVLRVTLYPWLCNLPTNPAVLQQLHRLEALHGDWALRWRQCGGRGPYARPLVCGPLSGQWVLLRRPWLHRGSILTCVDWRAHTPNLWTPVLMGVHTPPTCGPLC